MGSRDCLKRVDATRRVPRHDWLKVKVTSLYLVCFLSRLQLSTSLNVSKMDDDFEELTCGDELLQGSSQESLTGAAANMCFLERAGEDSLYNASQSLKEYTYDDSRLPRALEKEAQAAAVSPGDLPGHDLKSYPKYTSWYLMA